MKEENEFLISFIAGEGIMLNNYHGKVSQNIWFSHEKCERFVQKLFWLFLIRKCNESTVALLRVKLKILQWRENAEWEVFEKLFHSFQQENTSKSIITIWRCFLQWLLQIWWNKKDNGNKLKLLMKLRTI